MIPTTHLPSTPTTIKEVDESQQHDAGPDEGKSLVPTDVDAKDAPTLESAVNGDMKKPFTSPDVQTDPSISGSPSPLANDSNSALQSNSVKDTQSPEWNRSYKYCAPSRDRIRKSEGVLCFREDFMEPEQIVATSLNHTASATALENGGMSKENLNDVFGRSLKEVEEKPADVSAEVYDWSFEVEERSTIVKFGLPRYPVAHPPPKVSWLSKKTKELRAAAWKLKDRFMGSSKPRPDAHSHQHRPPKRPPACFKVWDQTSLWNLLESPLIKRSLEYTEPEAHPIRIVHPPAYDDQSESDFDPETPLT